MSLDLACVLISLFFSFLRRLLWAFSSTVVGLDLDLESNSSVNVAGHFQCLGAVIMLFAIHL